MCLHGCILETDKELGQGPTGAEEEKTVLKNVLRVYDKPEALYPAERSKK